MSAAAKRHPPRVLIAAGGTAGHVVPALAIAGALRDSGAEVEFAGGERAEAELVPAAGYPFHPLEVAGLDRRNPVRAARAAGLAARAFSPAPSPHARTRPATSSTPAAAATTTTCAPGWTRSAPRRTTGSSPTSTPSRTPTPPPTSPPHAPEGRYSSWRRPVSPRCSFRTP